LPKAKLILELDDAKDCFEILKGNEKFKHSRVSLELKRDSLVFEVDAEDSKSMVSAVGSVIKQLHIIREASDAIKKG
jgi:tRNA threonylcarbamoyladenosine modification (KEOPS) complex  Pcc1 subunit